MSETEWPLTAEQIAERWSCTPRWLKELARSNGCGRRAVKRLIFFHDDYEQLKAALPAPSANGVHQPPAPRGPKAAAGVRAAQPKKRVLKPPGDRSGKRDYMKDRPTVLPFDKK